VALVPGPSAHTLLLQALANLPEMSPKQHIVNKNQLAILSMWICGMPCWHRDPWAQAVSRAETASQSQRAVTALVGASQRQAAGCEKEGGL